MSKSEPNQKPHKKSWKEHLLSSGVPLEYSVARVFEELGIWKPEEFRYVRKNADGVATIFSVDIHSTDLDQQRNLWVESLVECKYRHDGTRWVFAPRDYEELFGPTFQDLFVTLDQCCLERRLDRQVVGKYGKIYPLCGKGVELLPDDANPKTIEHAVHQLRYAVIAKALDYLQHQTDGLLGSITPMIVIVPIIVTTAELWRLNVGTTVEDIRAAKEIEDVAKPHDKLVLLQPPDNLETKSTHEAFHDILTDVQKSKLNDLLSQTSKQSFEHFVQIFASYTPSLFLIISYKKVREAMGNMHRFFGQHSLIQPRQREQ
jgi:hypothetical protein